MSLQRDNSSATGLENSEPKAGSGPVPVWLIVLFGVIFYSGQLYINEYAGEFSPLVYDPYPSLAAVKKANPQGEDLVAKGEELFSVRCAVCHQAAGLGVAGQFPPLAGSEWVQAPGPGRPIRIVLNSVIGEIQVKGETFNNPAMPPWRDLTTDEEVAAILTYVRQAWGNKAPPVKPQQVKEVREKTSDRGRQWTAPELLEIPESE
jgi:mono/diheme cytochrome c family protein